MFDYLANKVADLGLGATAFTSPATVYLALGVASTWAASTAVALNAYNVPTGFATGGTQRIFKCTTAGTTAASEPTWPTTIAGTVTDGTVVWTEQTRAINSGTIPEVGAVGGYARLSITNNTTNFPVGALNADQWRKQNGTVQQFPTATALQGQVVMWAYFDAVTAGNGLWWGYVSNNPLLTINNNNQWQFAANAMTVNVR